MKEKSADCLSTQPTNTHFQLTNSKLLTLITASSQKVHLKEFGNYAQQSTREENQFPKQQSGTTNSNKQTLHLERTEKESLDSLSIIFQKTNILKGSNSTMKTPTLISITKHSSECFLWVTHQETQYLLQSWSADQQVSKLSWLLATNLSLQPPLQSSAT